MVTATRGEELLAQVMRSDRGLSEMLGRNGGGIETEALVRSVEAAYNLGYVAGFTCAQQGVRDAIGVPADR